MGVDPGVNGGIAVLFDTGDVRAVYALKPGMAAGDLVSIVRQALSVLPTIVYMEKVGYIAGDGPQGSYTFGRVNGLLEGALLALGASPRLVAPQMWQAALGCLSGGDKNVTKRRAQQLFPALGKAVTHNTADALLIAEFGRRRLFL